MRNRLTVAAIAALLFVGAFTVAFAQTDPTTSTGREFMIQGTTQKVFDDEQVLLVRVKSIVPEAAGPDAARGGIKVNDLIYVHVPIECAVIDEDGKNLSRKKDDDDGWDELDDEGAFLQLSLNTGRKNVKLESGDFKGTVPAYEARQIQILKD